MDNFTYYIINVGPFLRNCLRMALSNVLTITTHHLQKYCLSSCFFKNKSYAVLLFVWLLKALPTFQYSPYCSLFILTQLYGAPSALWKYFIPKMLFILSTLRRVKHIKWRTNLLFLTPAFQFHSIIFDLTIFSSIFSCQLCMQWETFW